jgi:hypothetical protein
MSFTLLNELIEPKNKAVEEMRPFLEKICKLIFMQAGSYSSGTHFGVINQKSQITDPKGNYLDLTFDNSNAQGEYELNSLTALCIEKDSPTVDELVKMYKEHEVKSAAKLKFITKQGQTLLRGINFGTVIDEKVLRMIQDVMVMLSHDFKREMKGLSLLETSKSEAFRVQQELIENLPDEMDVQLEGGRFGPKVVVTCENSAADPYKCFTDEFPSINSQSIKSRCKAIMLHFMAEILKNEGFSRKPGNQFGLTESDRHYTAAQVNNLDAPLRIILRSITIIRHIIIIADVYTCTGLKRALNELAQLDPNTKNEIRTYE